MTSLFILITISTLAGILTVLSPCVLPLLPVILWGSLAGSDKKRPYIIIASLILSLMLFTIILKASTLLIDIDPKFWDYFSAGILIVFWLTLLFPKIWSYIMMQTGLEQASQSTLQSASEKGNIWWLIGIGAALGPVFSSCNPTYSLLLATILPLNIQLWLVGLAFYFIGLGSILLLITLFGRKILGKFSFFVNPRGFFRRSLGVIIIFVGIAISLGSIKQIQTWVVENGNLSFVATIEERLNDIINTKAFSREDKNMVCSGKNCMPKNPEKSGILMDMKNAPEIVGVSEWINSKPLTLQWLRGKVVLIDFWTYSCINCKRTQPYLNTWHTKYANDWLVIIGLHAPEFAFERLSKNVQKSVIEAKIQYPVGLDNDFKTWNAYDNKYWPAKYLIDQKWDIVYKHFWEWEYAATEKKIQELLGIQKDISPVEQKYSSWQKNTPETYLGTSRGKLLTKDVVKIWLHEWQTFGAWNQQPEFIEATKNGTLMKLNFRAKNAYLVVSGEWTGKLQVSTYKYFEDWISVKQSALQEKIFEIHQDELYHIFAGDISDNYTLQITASPGLRLHAFTFWN